MVKQFHASRLNVLLFNLASHGIISTKTTTGVTSRAGTAYPSGAPEFTPMFFFNGIRLLDL